MHRFAVHYRYALSWSRHRFPGRRVVASNSLHFSDRIYNVPSYKFVELRKTVNLIFWRIRSRRLYTLRRQDLCLDGRYRHIYSPGLFCVSAKTYDYFMSWNLSKISISILFIVFDSVGGNVSYERYNTGRFLASISPIMLCLSSVLIAICIVCKIYAYCYKNKSKTT